MIRIFINRLPFYNFFIRNRCYSSLLNSYTPEFEPNGFKLRHIDLIHQYIGGDKNRILNALMENMSLQLVDEKNLEQKLNIIQEMMLADRNTVKIVPLLLFHKVVLQNRYRILFECGFIPYLISSHHIKRFFSFCKMSVSTLKIKELIKKDHLVLKGLWNAAGLDMKNYIGESENDSLHNLKIIALKAFLKEKLEYSEEEWEANKNSLIFRLKNKSFESINKSYKLYKETIGLSNKRIRNNWFVLASLPENGDELLNDVKGVANVDMKLILHLYPKIGVMPVENFQRIIKYLDDTNIPHKKVLRCLQIFTLNCETVLERLLELEKEEFFLYNAKTPHAMELVFYQVKAKKRLKILRDLNLEPTTHSLCNITDENFQKFCEKGARNFGNDTLNYIISELDIKKEEFQRVMRRHRRWFLVPIIHVGRNLLTLRRIVSDAEIKKNIQVLFYYSPKLNKILKGLDSQEGLEEFKEGEALKKEWILPLALYFLEMESNFSGESIWDTDDMNPYQDLPDIPNQYQ